MDLIRHERWLAEVEQDVRDMERDLLNRENELAELKVELDGRKRQAEELRQYIARNN